jgi:hypothetical protein
MYDSERVKGRHDAPHKISMPNREPASGSGAAVEIEGCSVSGTGYQESGSREEQYCSVA